MNQRLTAIKQEFTIINKTHSGAEFGPQVFSRSFSNSCITAGHKRLFQPGKSLIWLPLKSQR